ncbi:thiolase [Polychaeton citri CBS 116435]|uniref:Thiolase n=1 Tax=Polychaeton citri CBS 116435 TaxID=1314669 RepID=A0A9P4UM66_9PEZI|nr:thiolase [Polychaeton citri CBS 116435]
MAAARLSSVLSHISPSKSSVEQITQQNPDDVVITLAIRTPLTKARKGGFKDTPLDGLVFKILEQVVRKSNIDPQLVEDICLGNVSDPKAAYYVRAACLAAGFPNTTAASAVNRFCSSGLKATQDIANQIITGAIDVGVAVGAESMSTATGGFSRPFVDEIMNSGVQDAADCLQPMGQTSENVGKDFNITRELQDRYAAESYRRAEAAQKAGLFEDEIVPVKTTVKDPKTGEEKEITVSADEGPRWGTTFESLSKIRPAFKEFGDKSTGGNSSQVTDGAAAVMLMRRSKALELGQPILAKFVGATVAGLAPRIMGIGPSIAIPKLLTKYNLTIEDIDVVELNEAFASMAVYCRDTLKLDWEKMNVRGGAIALGHPLGCTGARQIVTGLSEARRQKKKILLTSMCIGTGQGMAGLFVNEQL